MADQKPKIIALIPKRMQIVEVSEFRKNDDGMQQEEQDSALADEHMPTTTPKVDEHQHTSAKVMDKHGREKQNNNVMRSSSSSNDNHEETDVQNQNYRRCSPQDPNSPRLANSNTRNNNKCTDCDKNSSQESRPLSYDGSSSPQQEERLRLLSLRDELEYKLEENDKILVGRIRDISTLARKMATLAPKSPKPVSKNDKEESIWDKFSTIGRKKRMKEVQDVQEEGKYAIDSPGSPTIANISPEDYDLDENEERSMLQPGASENPKFLQLNKVLIDWINDELCSQRIIVQDLAEDLYDGQVLQKLLEKLTGDKLDSREVTQSEKGQKEKLNTVLSHFNYVLGLHRTGSKKWNVEAIHSKNIVSIMHLLVALARHFRPPVRLIEHVSVPVVVVKKTNGILNHHIVNETITTAYDDVGMRCERDAFDTLFDHAPDKLQVVKKSLVTFVNKHLNKINLEVTELETQFHDGVYLTLLMGLLEGFFVPLYSFHLTPKDFEQKVHNVMFAFELMEEVGFMKLKARPEDIVNQDLKSTLRVLYNLFLKYRHL